MATVVHLSDAGIVVFGGRVPEGCPRRSLDEPDFSKSLNKVEFPGCPILGWVMVTKSPCAHDGLGSLSTGERTVKEPSNSGVAVFWVGTTGCLVAIESKRSGTSGDQIRVVG